MTYTNSIIPTSSISWDEKNTLYKKRNLPHQILGWLKEKYHTSFFVFIFWFLKEYIGSLTSSKSDKFLFVL